MTFRKGHIPWNKTRKASQQERHNLSIAHVGQIAWNKGMNKDQMLRRGNKVGSWPKGVPRSPETNEKISKANKGNHAWNKGITKQDFEGQKLRGGCPKGTIPWNKGLSPSIETRQKIGEASKGRKPSQETLRKQSLALKGHPTSEETRRKIGQANKLSIARKWQDAEYKTKQVIKIARGNRWKPNKPELLLDSWLQKEFPGEWKYVGDGRDGTSIGGKIPDWINVNGQKAVIELFGHYWHSLPGQSYSRTPQGTLEHYSKYGFRCLIFDDRELKEREKTMEKIMAFRSSI